MLDAALRVLACSISVGLDAGTATLVLGLVKLAVDDFLEHDEQHADEDREEGDADVCL